LSTGLPGRNFPSAVINACVMDRSACALDTRIPLPQV
jgi:hypothetical protein